MSALPAVPPAERRLPALQASADDGPLPRASAAAASAQEAAGGDGAGAGSGEVELVYDAALQAYFDPRTNRFFQLVA